MTDRENNIIQQFSESIKELNPNAEVILYESPGHRIYNC